MEIEKINDRLIKVETDLGGVKTDIIYIKEDVKDAKQRQTSNETSINDIKQMTSVLTETNTYLKEMIVEFRNMFEKINCKQDDYEKIANDRYIEIIKANSKQDCEVKTNEIDELKNRKDSFREWTSKFGIKILEYAISAGLILGVVFGIMKIGGYI